LEDVAATTADICHRLDFIDTEADLDEQTSRICADL
jgi:hypothetical protein